MNNSVTCMKCKHFYVTWDIDAPRGCKVFGFKGKQVPCVAVRAETGQDCSAYVAKKPVKESQGLDLNDPKNW